MGQPRSYAPALVRHSLDATVGEARAVTADQVTTEAQPRRRPLQVGILLPTWATSMGGATPRWTDVLALARRAEAVGLDALWLGDHLLFPRADLLAHFRVPGAEHLDPANEERLGTWEGWSL